MKAVELFLVPILFMTFGVPMQSIAAEFKYQESKKETPQGILMAKVLSIKGEIVSGDYERFEAVLLKNNPATISIDSPGGNLSEAIKIGSLINKTYQKVIVLNCYSACTFIALSSPFRAFLGKFGLHRPYFEPEIFAALPPDEASAYYKKLRKYAHDYLIENYVSRNVVDRMFETSSENMWVLSADDAQDTFGYFQPPFQEWLIAKCGAQGAMSQCGNQTRIEASTKAILDIVLFGGKPDFKNLPPPR